MKKLIVILPIIGDTFFSPDVSKLSRMLKKIPKKQFNSYKYIYIYI